MEVRGGVSTYHKIVFSCPEKLAEESPRVRGLNGGLKTGPSQENYQRHLKERKRESGERERESGERERQRERQRETERETELSP